MSVRGLASFRGAHTICYVPATGSISTADGSALVRMGDTTIVCGVKAEIAEPDLDRPDQGFLGHHSFHTHNSEADSMFHAVPNLDLPAICSPKFKPGPPTEEAQVLSDRLNEALVTSVVQHYLFWV